MQDIDKQIESAQTKLTKEFESLKNQILKPVKNKKVHLKILQQRLSFIKWNQKKLDLYSTPHPKMIRQREVFYCELGQNIGSEQDGRRPVIIIQNNVGNAHAKITLVAPITSFRKGSLLKENGKLFLLERKGNKNQKRLLRFYDIPLELEEDSKYPIYGVANISQLRVVSKSRLSQTPVAKVTQANFEEILAAIHKNISIFEDQA